MTVWGVRAVPQGQPFGPIQAVRKSVVRIDRAGNKAKLEDVPLADASPTGSTGFAANISAFDGATQYDYLAARKQYQTTTYTNLTDGLRGVGFGNIPLALALGWKFGNADKFTSAADETLDGKAYKVYARTYQV